MNPIQKIEKIKALKYDLYDSIDLDSLVVFCLLFLEERKIPLYFEYVAVALFRIFPKRFSMESFPEFPDLIRSHNSIRRLAGSLRGKKENWANGNMENGFILTRAGREKAAEVSDLLNGKTNVYVKNIKTKRSRGRSANEDVSAIKNSLAFKKWKERKKISNLDIYSLFRTMPYASKELLKKQKDFFIDAAKVVNDKEVKKFFSYIEKEFSEVFD